MEGYTLPDFREIREGTSVMFEITVTAYPAFAQRARAMGRCVKHLKGKQRWRFPLSREKEVTDLHREVFGDPGPTATCRVLVGEGRRSIWGLGRRIASLDSNGVALGEGAALLRGGFYDSRDHIMPRGETVLEVTSVPLDLARREAAASGGTLDVVGETDRTVLETLLGYFNVLSAATTKGFVSAHIDDQALVVGDGIARVTVWPGFFEIEDGEERLCIERSLAVSVAGHVLKLGFAAGLAECVKNLDVKACRPFAG